MKTAFLFALFLTEMAAVAEPPVGTGQCARRPLWAEPVGERALVLPAQETLSACQAASLPPVAARASRRSLANPKTILAGGIPRALTVRDPVQMISPFAPLRYGSGLNMVTFTERDPYRTDNTNKYGWQTDGLRFLTLRPLW